MRVLRLIMKTSASRISHCSFFRGASMIVRPRRSHSRFLFQPRLHRQTTLQLIPTITLKTRLTRLKRFTWDEFNYSIEILLKPNIHINYIKFTFYWNKVQNARFTFCAISHGMIYGMYINNCCCGYKISFILFRLSQSYLSRVIQILLKTSNFVQKWHER